MGKVAAAKAKATPSAKHAATTQDVATAAAVKPKRLGRPKGAAKVDGALTVSIGCDCAGIETPIMALENLGVKVNHRLSCDIDPAVRRAILANFCPQAFFDDVTVRDNAYVPKDLDLYVAGFPCQTFSVQGKNAGTNDPRGMVVVHIIRYIKECRPKAFVLENVKGLIYKRHKPTFLAILKCPLAPLCVALCHLVASHCQGRHLRNMSHGLSNARCLQNIGGGAYNIKHAVLCPTEHGIPHHRPRLYIVGVQKKTNTGSSNGLLPLVACRSRPSCRRQGL
jgi:site-specific DNA-cytosine methylase